MKRFTSAVLCVLMILSCFTFVASAAEGKYAPEVGDGYIRFDYNQIACGFVNHKKYGVMEKNMEIDGVKAVKFTPAPTEEDAAASTTYSLDCWNLANYEAKVEVPKYKYVGVKYYYATDNPTFNDKMEFNILPGNTKATDSLTVKSAKPVVTNQWAEAIFDFSSVMKLKETDKPWINQAHFRPFPGMAPSLLKAEDVLYIAEYSFYERNPDPNARVTITFQKGDPGAIGEVAPIEVKPGEKYTLPEPAYTFEGYAAEFKGWQRSSDSEIFPAGTEFVADGGLSFKALWEIETDKSFISIDFKDYEDGIVNHKKTATIEIVEFEGKNVVKVTPDPTSTEAKQISLDGWSYEGAGIDLGVFKYFAIEYKYVSKKPVDENMVIAIMTNGGILTKSPSANSTTKIVEGQWTLALFEFPGIDELLAPNKTVHNMKQMHIRPWGTTELSAIHPEDRMYIGSIMFFRDKPELVEHNAYMTGYNDASFKPNKTMTRAEACTVVARLLDTEENIAKNTTTLFTDVAADKWYTKYISFCEAKGLLKSYSGTFLPEQNITRAEFAELVYNMGLAKEDAANKKTFTDVTEAHPKYAAIMAAASAGLIGGYEDGTFLPDRTITRAQVVTIINRAKGISKKAENITDSVDVIFTDVDATHWAFADIAEATVPHAELDGSWVYCIEDPLVKVLEHMDEDEIINIEAGKAKVAELDALEAKRIEEIRNTPSMDLSHITGKKIYVSNNGKDTNDGLTPETAVASISKAMGMAGAGGAVLLERGGFWRTKFTVPAGVTVTAYGEGAKPTIYGSPEDGADPAKWALVYKDDSTGAKIWKYANEGMTDVGTLVFNHGEGFAMKEIPTSKGKKFVVRGTDDVEFDYKKELDKNFEFFHRANSVVSGNIINASTAVGPLYFRCDNGNPGEVFDSIEFNTKGNIISANNNVTVDNLCIMYGGSHGIGMGTVKNVKFTNLEVGWIGGSIQSYNANSTTDGRATRFGNGIEVYGGCDGYTIDNCYVYQCYDAGVTHQLSGSATGDYREDNVTYSNNVITECVYSIEYFLGLNGAYVREGKNILFEGNLLRRAGFGFGSFRPDGNNQRHIRGGSGNQFENYVIRNNIFDRSVYELVQTTTVHPAYVPKYEGNTYIQGLGNRVYYSGVPAMGANADLLIENKIRRRLGDETAKFYFVENVPYWTYDYVNPKTSDKEYPVVADVDGGAAPVAPAVPAEPEEVKDPYFVRTAAGKEAKDSKTQLYAAARDSMNVEFKTDADSGIKYAHVTTTGKESTYNMDCYGLNPVIPFENGKAVIKVLMRTNATHSTNPAIVFYHLMQEDETEATGKSVEAKLSAYPASDGTWQEMYFVAENVSYVSSSQIHLLFAGRTAKGTDFKEGQYYDVAAWAAFPNLTSAKAYDLKKDCVAK